MRLVAVFEGQARHAGPVPTEVRPGVGNPGPDRCGLERSELAAALYKPDVLVVASSSKLLKSAIDVLDSKAANLSGKQSPLAANASQGAGGNFDRLSRRSLILLVVECLEIGKMNTSRLANVHAASPSDLSASTVSDLWRLLGTSPVGLSAEEVQRRLTQ